jgi:ribosome biogenesis GTPase
MKGLIYKSTGSWYQIQSEDGRRWDGRLKGKFKIDDITSTNPIAVGDEVGFEIESGIEEKVIITELHPRKNYINRVSPSNRRLQHIIASNLDQSLLVATLKDPKTSQGFIDRFLVTCEAYHIPAILLFNKADIYGDKEMNAFENRREMYEKIGYGVLLSSVKTGLGMEELHQLLKNKTTLISGHSGVGKSSIINSILVDANLKTQEVSGWSGKGMHTTTFAEMFDLAEGGRIIDTPGMREFALADIDRQELSHYFPEMKDRISQCQFNNCLHYNEPGCAIKQAVIDGKIHEDRYISYCTLLDGLEERSW